MLVYAFSTLFLHLSTQTAIPEGGGVACVAGQDTLASRGKGVLEVFRGDDKEVRRALLPPLGGQMPGGSWHRRA